MPSVSVIIVNYNGKPFLGELLESLARQSQPAFEVILVDNASTDGSVQHVCEQFPWVKVIRSPSNLGFAGGNNLGYTQAKGEFLALLNSDTVLDVRFLAETVKALEAHPTIAAIVPKIYQAYNFPEIDTVGAAFNNLGNYWQRHYQDSSSSLDEEIEVAGLAGCAVVLRKTALREDGLFDPTFFMYYEEFELSLRLRGRGYGILYVPTAHVFHKGGQSVKQITDRPKLFQQFYSNSHRMKILAKFYPGSVLLRSLPLLALSFVYWNSIFLFKGGPRYFLRAVRSQCKFFRAGIRERNEAKSVDPKAWLPWMTPQGLKEVLRVKRTIRNQDYYEEAEAG